MCQYRYYYYGGCQHQETVLYSFCRHAAAVQEQSPSPGEASANGVSSAATTYFAPSTPQRSPGTSSPSPYSSSSVPTSLTSLKSLSDPSQDTTSFFQHPFDFHHLRNLSPIRRSEHNMSALVAFSGMNLRDLLSGKSNQTISPEKPAASHDARDSWEKHHTPVGHPRHEHSGSRQRGDGSWELLTGNANSESNSTERSEFAQISGSDGCGQPQVGREASGSYDFLSSELDALKVEVDQIKKETDLEFEVQKNTPKSSYAGTKKAPAGSIPPQSKASVRSKIPAPSQKETTVLPQRAHENKQPSATPSEHPSLTSAPSMNPSQVRETGSKPSAKPSLRKKDSCHSSPATVVESAGAQVNLKSAPDNDHVDGNSTKSSTVSPSAELSKGTPHFAQPTVAAVIRRETVRRDSAICHGTTTPEGSPKRSNRSGVPRQTKRAPLPGGWIDPTDHQNAAASTDEAPNASHIQDELEAQRSTEDTTGQEVVKQEQILRKKTSTSYMSPTKATTLRNLATMGQVNTKRTSPRVARAPLMTDINTTISPVKELMTAGSIVSDSGSEKIITEMNINRAGARSDAQQTVRNAPTCSKSPTGIIPSELRRRMTVGVSVADVLAQHARSSAFPSITNTTRKRRESTGDLLNPIRARLNKVGLLSGSIYQGEAASSSSAVTAKQQMPQHPSEASVQFAEAQTPVVESKPAFQPPHRRHLAAKAAEAMNAAYAASLLSYHDNQVPMPSLRATAAEFTPRAKTVPPNHAFTAPTSAIPDWRSAVKFRTVEEWASLSPDDKRLVQAARHFQRTGGEMPIGRVVGQQHWQGILRQHVVAHPGPSLSYADVYGTDVTDGEMSPYRRLGADGLQWTVYDADGEKGTVHFGDGSPLPVPRSAGGSPRRAPMSSPNSWTIGADANTQNTFGWTGGAGREIKFVGYGPDAERDPHTPVSFNFRGGNSRSGGNNRNEVGPRMIGDKSYDGSPQAPLAPRSKAQWAKLKEYTRVPCSDVEITHAVELLPVPALPGQTPLAGYCNDCAHNGY